MAGITIVFDFDRTIIDGDSDRWVVTEMGLTELFNELRLTLPWNSLMDRMMMELHSLRKTSTDITECLKRAPLHPRIISAIKSARDLGCNLRIISDANQFFIERILGHHGILECFSHIYTNPSFVDGEGRLRIFPYHDLSLPSHDCNLCPLNMCKGLIMDQISASASSSGRRRFIYLGDGNGDFCPTMRLSKCDHVMPRKNYPLWNRVCSNQVLVKAQVHEWSNGNELETKLVDLIRNISNQEISGADSNILNSFNIKNQNIPPLEVAHQASLVCNGDRNNLGCGSVCGKLPLDHDIPL